jgi:hypothetical protein
MIIPAKSQFNWFGGFWQEDFQGFNQLEHAIGPGSHVEFPIYTKNTNLVEDHPMNMYGKFVSVSALTWFLAHLAIVHVSVCHG